MLKYIVGKYWWGVVLAVLFYWMGMLALENQREAMMFVVGMGFLFWTFRLLYLVEKGSPKGPRMVNSLMSLAGMVWKVVSLRPLRWGVVRRLRIGGLCPPLYPYLAMYGCLLDTHMMQYKVSCALYRDKGRMARAALWRLVARGVVLFAQDKESRPVLCVKGWKPSPSDGLDDKFEHALYGFLVQAQRDYGCLQPRVVGQVICFTEYGLNRGKAKPWQLHYDKENQFVFSDLLNTNLGFSAYPESDVRKMLGMKRFLKGLPESFGKADMIVPLDIAKVWTEYVAYAYVFGMENRVLRAMRGMVGQGMVERGSTLDLVLNSRRHRRLLDALMQAVADATPVVEDSVSGDKGLMKIAWHVVEIYDV